MTVTPTLSRHARERCAEMGISTKIAKRIVQAPSVVYPGAAKYDNGTLVALSSAHPEYAVVYAPEQVPVIVTVLFHIPEQYERQGPTYRVIDVTDRVAV